MSFHITQRVTLNLIKDGFVNGNLTVSDASNLSTGAVCTIVSNTQPLRYIVITNVIDQNNISTILFSQNNIMFWDASAYIVADQAQLTQLDGLAFAETPLTVMQGIQSPLNSPWWVQLSDGDNSPAILNFVPTGSEYGLAVRIIGGSQNTSGSVSVTNFPAVQGIAGNVGIIGTIPVSGTFWQAIQPISGSVNINNPVTSVSVNNFPVNQQISGNVGIIGTVPVSGQFWQDTQPVSISGTPNVNVINPVSSISINNFPSTQDIIGSVIVTNPVNAISVNNFPATQSIAGNVTIDNPVNAVSINNFPTVQNISGSVAVTNPVDSVAINNFPVSQNINGTVAISGSIPVTGTFWQPTQPISANSLPLPTNASQETGGNLDLIKVDLDNILNNQTNGAQNVQVTNLPANQAVNIGPVIDKNNNEYVLRVQSKDINSLLVLILEQLMVLNARIGEDRVNFN